MKNTYNLRRTATPDLGSLIASIKDQVNLEQVATKLDIIGKYNLQKKGSSLQGDCPTGHSSKGHLCFSLDLDDNLYHCFQCGEAGDIVDLVVIINKVSRFEATKWLIDAFVPHLKPAMDEFTDAQTPEQKEYNIRGILYRLIYEEGKRQLQLPIGKVALDYLVNNRGYDITKISSTEFIYLDLDANIRSYLKKQLPNLSQQIDDLNLQGAYGDQFRLAIPFRDRHGVITGFLKRAHIPAGFTINNQAGLRWDSTKGLTKPDLFGLNRIRNQKRIILVEGYPDATYLPALGLDNIVACGQAAFSDKYIEGLTAKGIEQIILALDNDSVGPKNSEEICRLFADSNIKVFVIDPPLFGGQKDPDEFVKTNGIDAFKKLVDAAESGAKWYAKRLLSANNLSNDIERDTAVDEILEFASTLSDPIQVQEILDDVAIRLKLLPDILLERYEQFKQKTAARKLQDGIKDVVSTSSKLFAEGQSDKASSIIAQETQKLLVEFSRSKIEIEQPLEDFLNEKEKRDAKRVLGSRLGYELKKFVEIDKQLSGIQPGLYIIAADPNMGKTILQINIAVDLLMSNSDLSLNFYTMDDSRDAIVSRFISKLTAVPINNVQQKPSSQKEEKLIRYAYEQLKEWVKAGRLNIHELTEALTMESINMEIREHKNRQKLVVVIDGLYNVPLHGEYHSIREENISRANQVKELVKLYKLPLIASAELRKREQGDSGRKGRTLHDIMETGKYGYNADVVMLLHPKDVSAYNREQSPVINVEFCKNKLSGYRDIITMEFTKQIATFIETGTIQASQWEDKQ